MSPPAPEARFRVLHPDRLDGEPAMTLLRPPSSLRRLAWGIGLAVPLFLLLLLVVPWQQAAQGQGRVIAFSPMEREQAVEAPVTGMIEQFFVMEGQFVEAGDPLVELRDPDPELMSRLERQRDATQDAYDAVVAQIRSYEAKLRAEQAGRDLVVAEYEAKIGSLERKRSGEQSVLDTEQRNLERTQTLAREGIASSRDLEVAGMKADKARAAVEALDREIASVRQAQSKAAADAEAKIASVQADLESTRSKLASAEGKVLDQDVKVSRQARQLVRAPRAGTVLRLYGGPGAGTIKAGDTLVTMVPETDQRAVELYVDGNDMPLMEAGDPVRLVFEGWPALQFVGLRGVSSTGTFGGRLAFVDATDDGKGKFRIVVLPDDEDAPWPDAHFLRQGVRTKGWVLLGQVSLGYELWRQINGFPALPSIDKGEKPTLPSGKKPKAPTGLGSP
jgi:adhesin transport system membrane fusion protein